MIFNRREFLHCALIGLGAATLSGCARADEAAPNDVTENPKSSPVTAKAGAPLLAANELAQMDALYEGVLPWIVRLYDADKGGFYESLATRKLPNTGPDIQSTAMVLSLLDEHGILDDAPPAAKARLANYFQSRQNAKTGMFTDPDYPQMEADERIVGRALAFSKTGLERLGAEPLHPLAGDPDNAVPERFASAENLKKWLDARPWEQPWEALGNISSQKAVLRTLPEPQRTAMVRQIYDYAVAKQDPKTGFIGGKDGATIIQISGMAKFGWFALAYDLPIPNADAIYASVMKWYRSKPQVDTLTMVRNPIHHLNDLQPFLTQPMSAEDKALVIRESVRMMQPFHQKDGAFSMQSKEFRLRPNDMWPPIGKSPQPQSDVNGTSQAHVIRQKAYELAGADEATVLPIPHGNEFWQMMSKAD